jgi:6-pyruvoyltetrahydropterin/6-carboxytetrahydropterin synthase
MEKGGKRMLLRREFSFDAAHRLEQYHGKCEALHGHTYRFAVTIAGDPDAEGMVLDFVELKRIVSENVLSSLDHSYLNNVIPQPTAEYIALWIWRRIEPFLRERGASLFEVQVWETATCSVILRREDLEKLSP